MQARENFLGKLRHYANVSEVMPKESKADRRKKIINEPSKFWIFYC